MKKEILKVIVITTFAQFLVTNTSAQTTGSGDLNLPELMEPAREIALARSAAPAAVSANATVLILRRGGYEVAVQGSNGVTCYVSRSWAAAIEPHCFDREGSETILQVHLLQARLREEGMSKDAIERAVADSLANGELRVPRRPAVSWMMSAAQDLYNDDGNHVGAWKPHFMIYYPYLTAADLGMDNTNTLDAGVVVDGGSPLANLMIVVPSFVEPERPDTLRTEND